MQQAKTQTSPAAFLVCTPKHFGPAEEERAAEEASGLLAALGVNPQCVPGGEWFRESFSKHGNWDSWIWDTVHGKDYNTRALRFAGFVLCGREVGRATAGIARTALQSSRVVLAVVDSTLYAVTDVVEQDSNRWSDGWTLALSPIGD